MRCSYKWHKFQNTSTYTFELFDFLFPLKTPIKRTQKCKNHLKSKNDSRAIPITNKIFYKITFIWWRSFILQQDCPNGRLTPAKFVDMYKMFFPSGNAEEFCDHVFRTFDMDKNGYIDFKVGHRSARLGPSPT